MSKKFIKKWDENNSKEYKQIGTLFNTLINELDEKFKVVNEDTKKILNEAQVAAKKNHKSVKP